MDILNKHENKHYIVMFGFVYAVTLAYFISMYVFGGAKKSESNQPNNDEYENDSDDSSSVESNEDKQDFDESENIEGENLDIKEDTKFPKLSKLFSKLTKNQLKRIVGKSNKYKSKSEMVEIAIDKFKKRTIEKSLVRFEYFPKYIKIHSANNLEQYSTEINELFNCQSKEKIN